MEQTRTLPSIRQLLLQAEEQETQIIGAPYSQWNCWHLVRFLFQAGRGIDLDADPRRNINLVYEHWWHEDATDPLTTTQPWDIWVFNCRGLASDHLGVVVDATQMVHTSKTHGVTIEKLHRWQPHLLLIYRLRTLR